MLVCRHRKQLWRASQRGGPRAANAARDSPKRLSFACLSPQPSCAYSRRDRPAHQPGRSFKFNPDPNARDRARNSSRTGHVDSPHHRPRRACAAGARMSADLISASGRCAIFYWRISSSEKDDRRSGPISGAGRWRNATDHWPARPWSPSSCGACNTELGAPS